MENLIFILPVLLLLFTSIDSTSTTTTISLENPISPSTLAKKMISNFNLFPDRSVNIVEEDNGLQSSTVGENNNKLVEKRFKFPGFVDPNGASIDDLGHHAGYYKIEHSHAARYNLSYFFNSFFSSFAIACLIVWSFQGLKGCP